MLSTVLLERIVGESITNLHGIQCCTLDSRAGNEKNECLRRTTRYVFKLLFKLVYGLYISFVHSSKRSLKYSWALNTNEPRIGFLQSDDIKPWLNHKVINVVIKLNLLVGDIVYKTLASSPTVFFRREINCPVSSRSLH